MGDRTWTCIKFSGVISEEQAGELAELLRHQGCQANSGATLLEGLKDPAGDLFYDSECNYAQMEEIESWCADNNVAYLKTWEPGGGYGPGIELWHPGMKAAEQCASVEGGPVATFYELKRAHGDGKVAELIADLDRFNNLGPPLQVLAVDNWTPELCVFMAKRKLESAL